MTDHLTTAAHSWKYGPLGHCPGQLVKSNKKRMPGDDGNAVCRHPFLTHKLPCVWQRVFIITHAASRQASVSGCTASVVCPSLGCIWLPGSGGQHPQSRLGHLALGELGQGFFIIPLGHSAFPDLCITEGRVHQSHLLIGHPAGGEQGDKTVAVDPRMPGEKRIAFLKRLHSLGILFLPERPHPSPMRPGYQLPQGDGSKEIEAHGDVDRGRDRSDQKADQDHRY